MSKSLISELDLIGRLEWLSTAAASGEGVVLTSEMCRSGSITLQQAADELRRLTSKEHNNASA